ncbi:disulfide bond formation protein B [Aromatoleum petrolei]|uniref:Disulfide bond formation protein B n=1 Tax=Aromatoleum petrolei TaxID=76116 RepID=A0ABX1MLD4_9RHOO|nr:disulfide bond formation protein B [Aromatoleum petrolei]NMF88777.1 disulfide bond formation protein B [Aromatoleum petrolei]QTQ36058.1 Disulfide bond formation protein B [Aromatoleum petrolei]
MMNTSTPPSRALFLGLFAACVGLLGFGLYLQHYVGLEPCPMCIMQRYAFIAIALFALVAGLHNPGRTGTRLYSGLILVAALAGGGVAARQTWMQIYPPEVAECGPDLEFMLGSFPLADALPMIFQGAGDCSKVDWSFLGLSIANWSLVMLTLVTVGAITVIVRAKGR